MIIIINIKMILKIQYRIYFDAQYLFHNWANLGRLCSTLEGIAYTLHEQIAISVIYCVSVLHRIKSEYCCTACLSICRDARDMNFYLMRFWSAAWKPRGYLHRMQLSCFFFIIGSILFDGSLCIIISELYINGAIKCI